MLGRVDWGLADLLPKGKKSATPPNGTADQPPHGGDEASSNSLFIEDLTKDRVKGKKVMPVKRDDIVFDDTVTN